MIAIPLLLALAAADPGGYLAARWGMTPDQVLAAIPEARELTSPLPSRTFKEDVARIGIPQITLGPDQAQVFFLINAQAGLYRVMIQPATADMDAFRRIEALLVQRYGRPWHRAGETTTQSQWSFPATTITLSYSYIPAIRFRSLWLTYERRQPVPL